LAVNDEGLGDILGRLFQRLGELIAANQGLLVAGLLIFAWSAYWLWGVNWQRAWQVLGQGAWVPLVLLLIMAALVWSRLAPGDCECLGFTTVPNFWWQLGGVGALTAWTLFLGWVQGYFGWQPPELDLEPPAPADHGHGDGHAHH
jgi:hypothetical protein